MNKAISLLTIDALLILSGCSYASVSSTHQAMREDASWNAFCDARGYDRNDDTYPVINEYVDTWCGSADEEAALIAAGVEPY